LAALEHLGPLREGPGLEAAVAEFERVEHEDLERLTLDPDCAVSDRQRRDALERALSLRNMALVGKAVATAALAREESRGAHHRLDHPARADDACRAVSRIERSADGGLQVHKDDGGLSTER